MLTRNVEPGDLVQPGRVLFEIARSGATEVLVPLDEKNLAVLAVGPAGACASPTRIRTSPFPATVNFIAPSVDPQRGTVDIRLTVDAGARLPAPGHDRVGERGNRPPRRGAGGAERCAAGATGRQRARCCGVVADGRATRCQVQLGLRGLAHDRSHGGPACRRLDPGGCAGCGAPKAHRVRVVSTGPARTMPPTPRRRENCPSSFD